MKKIEMFHREFPVICLLGMLIVVYSFFKEVNLKIEDLKYTLFETVEQEEKINEEEEKLLSKNKKLPYVKGTSWFDFAYNLKDYKFKFREGIWYVEGVYKSIHDPNLYFVRCFNAPDWGVFRGLAVKSEEIFNVNYFAEKFVWKKRARRKSVLHRKVEATQKLIFDGNYTHIKSGKKCNYCHVNYETFEVSVIWKERDDSLSIHDSRIPIFKFLKEFRYNGTKDINNL